MSVSAWLIVACVSYWIYFTLVRSIPALLHFNSVLVWPLASKSTRSYRLFTYSGHPDNRTVQPHACWRVDVKDKGSWGWMWCCPFSGRSIFLPWCQKKLRRWRIQAAEMSFLWRRSGLRWELSHYSSSKNAKMPPGRLGEGRRQLKYWFRNVSVFLWKTWTVVARKKK